MTWKDVKLLGVGPDMPNTTEGIFTQTIHVMPTDKGFGNTVRLTENSSALNSQSLGGTSVFKTDGTQRFFVGTATKLYEVSAPTPTTLTDRAGISYSASTTDTWSFTQFGDVTLAINKQNFLQQINAGAAFAAVGAAPVPKASIITTCGPTTAPFVMAFDYNDGTNNYRDGWFASGLGDYTGWTTGMNSCVNGRLLDDIPGPIVAAIGFRDGVIAWKSSGMYYGTYGDPTLIWTWQRISSDIGCIGKNAVVKANDLVYWADVAGIWVFDGSYPKLVPGAVHSYWSAQTATLIAASATHGNFFHLIWDKPKHVLHVLAGNSSGPSIPYGYSWNSVSGLWVIHRATPVFSNVAGTLTALEVFAPRAYVTNASKIGTFVWEVNGTEPVAGVMYCWVISDYIHSPVIKGVRPHISYHSASSTTYSTPTSNFSGTLASLTAEYFRTADLNTELATTAMVWRAPGRLDGQMGAPIMTFDITSPVGNAWEITGLSVDIDVGGKS